MITNVDTLDFDLSQHRKTIDDSGQISTGTNPNKKKIHRFGKILKGWLSCF